MLKTHTPFPLDGRLATYFDPKPWRGPPRSWPPQEKD